MKRLGTYLLIVGFITGQILWLWHLAELPHLFMKMLDFSAVVYHEFLADDFKSVGIKAGDSITITWGAFVKTRQAEEHTKWEVTCGADSGKPYPDNVVKITWSSSLGTAVVESEGWPNKEACPWDKDKQANVCR